MAHRELEPKELKDWRERVGFSQSAAAKWFNVSLRTYQGWEAGRRKRQAGIIRQRMRQKAEPKAKIGDRTLFD